MSKIIKVGNVLIGGGNPIVIQSMTNTDTKDVLATVSQINQLYEKGCDLVRLSIYDMDCIEALRKIKEQTSVPLIADIHFDYRLAIESIKAGIDKLRINPGNIGDESRVKQVASCAKDYGVPIRVGANSGSLPKDLMEQFGGVNEFSMVEAALRNVRILEENDFTDICISVKCSDVPIMVKSYELLFSKTDYPLHLGVTEAGTMENSTIKSAVGIGSLLLKDIGDTIRVSITGDPAKEPAIAKKILTTCGKLKSGLNVISCPTCARTGIDVEGIANKIEEMFSGTKKSISVAVMGCVVNGPGEAKEADIGIAGGKTGYVIFKNGEIMQTVKDDSAVELFFDEIRKMMEN